MARRRTVWSVAVLLGLLGLVAGEAWVPIGTERVRVQREPPAAAGPLLDFQGRSVLVGSPGPAWLREAVAAGRFTLSVRFMTFWLDQSGPAVILAISADADDADLVVGQEDRDLVIRVRRPGGDDAGRPEIRLDDVLRQSVPRDLDLVIDGSSMTVALDGEVVRQVELDDAPPPVSTWDAGHRVVIGDEEAGAHAWIGGMFEATVGGGATTEALIASGELHADVGIVEFERRRVIERPGDTAPVPMALRFAIFLPLGLMLGRLLRRPVAAVGVGVAVVLVIAIGKWFVPGRHPSLAEVLIGSAGTTAGVSVAQWWRRRKTTNLQSDPAPTGRI